MRSRLMDYCAGPPMENYSGVDNGSEIERILDTLCRHRGSLLLRPKSLSQKHFRWVGAPMPLLSVRKSG